VDDASYLAKCNTVSPCVIILEESEKKKSTQKSSIALTLLRKSVIGIGREYDEIYLEAPRRRYKRYEHFE